MIIYAETDYANNRLHGSIVRLGSEPVEVREINPSGACVVVHIDSGKIQTVPYTFLNIDPVPLGYSNYDGDSYYLVRMPMRNDWKQGLRYNNIRTWEGNKANFIPYSSLAKMIKGDYPSILQAKAWCTAQSVNSVAFSRQFSLFSTMKIKFRGAHIVGELTKNGPNLYDNFDWLDEVFNTEVVNAYRKG